ncbi:STY4851/ECs_5259 family protein [Ensifer sp. 22564]|uniref:STY4851/ECs_5259 family protein n=1 Tax=Ensifer sp. 22564 TaxID=3453943 RepID=UPI003F849EBE
MQRWEDLLRLSEYSDHDLREEFERRRTDLKKLEALNAELKSRDSDEAFDLQLEVVTALAALRKSENAKPRVDTIGRWFTAFLVRRGLQAPDGRPLHRYRMSDREYEEARVLLRNVTNRLLTEDGAAASLFVAFCAEWFRREATSLFLKWDNLTSDVFTAVPNDCRRHLAETGLKFWRRRLLRTDGGREFLLTLALEGGISAHVISEGGSSWLSDYLRAIMRFALTDAEPEHVRGYAHDTSWMVRVSYRQEGFVDLCHELILQLVAWRRTADKGPAGIDPVAYLDAHSPDWKDTLPIYIPAGDDKIARRLLRGLLAEKAGTIVASGITADRYLSFVGEQWVPAVLLNAEGEISAAKLQGVPTTGRWKASPSGELANFLPSQIALFEPPTDEQKTWRVRSVTPLGKLLVGVSLGHSITVNLTCGAEAIALPWPGGHAVGSPIICFLPEEPNAAGDPKKLRMVRTGSASLPAATVYVLVPDDWTAIPAEGSALGRTWKALGGKLVHEVTGTTYFLKPGAASSERYRIEAGKDERQETLSITSPSTSSIQSEEELDVLGGPVSIGIAAGDVLRTPKFGELLVRSHGGQWKPLAERRLTTQGVFEVSWRDPAANIQLERRQIAILPAGARISAEMLSINEGRIVYDRLQGWRVDLPGDFGHIENLDGEVRFRLTGRPRYRVEALLRPPIGRPFKITVPMRSREAAIILADGSVVSPGQHIDVTALRGSIATSPYNTTLTLSARSSHSSSLHFRFSGEFPLAALKPVVEELMAPMGDQDAILDLEFLGETRIPIRLRKYRYPRPSITENGISFGVEFSETPVVRMILQPHREHLLQKTPEGSYGIPDWCYGPCLVYLRDGPDVVARPLIVDQPTPTPSSSMLQSALSRTDFDTRALDIGSALDALEVGALPSEDVKFLLNLVASLNGLSPLVFDVLKDIAKRPRALLRLLLSASTDLERQAMWALQDQLPFLWLGLPLPDWLATFGAEFEALQNALSSLPDEVRSELVLGHVKNLREKLIALEPALVSIFVRAGFPPAENASLQAILQGFVQGQRMYDDDLPKAPVKRNPVLEQLSGASIRLPAEFERFSVAEFECMAAPAALAAMAVGRFTPTPLSELVLRKTLREHAQYVSSAYPHLLKFYEVCP